MPEDGPVLSVEDQVGTQPERGVERRPTLPQEGQSKQEIVNGYDDGRGGCVWAPTPLGGAGQRSETMYGGFNSPNQQLDTTTFNVQ